MTGAEAVLSFGYAWLAIGGLVALVFLTYGIDRIVEDARDVYLFRVLVAPGVVLLWPIVLWRWRQKELGTIAWQDQYSPRRRLAGLIELAMAVSLLIMLYIAATIAPDPALFPEPVKLSEISKNMGSVA